MKIRAILTIIICTSLAGCGHYNYAVNKVGSPIPYINQYDGDDTQEYEFYSTLYKVNPDKRHSDFIEITHLNDVYNHHHGTPESTWRISRLSFNLSKGSGIELVPDSVILEHYSKAGDLYKPSTVKSTLSKCTGTVGCREYLVLHYAEVLPKELIEIISFKVFVHGEEKHISYTIPLEYKYHYSFWDVMMGV
jgi:hypothetical protein